MTARGICEWAESTQGFYVDRTWRDGRWVLGSAPIVLAGYHADILAHCFTPDDDGRLPYDQVSICEPAKSGKSAVAGLIAVWAGLHLGANSDIIMASNAQRQAQSLMFKSALDAVNANPFLPNVQTGTTEINFSNGNRIVAIPSSSRSAAGARWSVSVFDELWGYVYRDAERLWAEMKTDPTRAVSTKVALGYAGYDDSELWLSVLEQGKAGAPVDELRHITNSDGAPACWANGRAFTFWSDQTRQPWQTDEWKAGLRKTLRDSEYRRMVKTEFVEGAGDFVTTDEWEALIDKDLPPIQPGDRRPLFVGLDLATAAGGDNAALVGIVPDDDGLALALHRVWYGNVRADQLKLGNIERTILGLARTFNLAAVSMDPWQGVYLGQRLQQQGIPVIAVNQNKSASGRSALDTALWGLVVDRRLRLYDHPAVVKAAAGARAEALPDNRIYLSKSGRRKIDLLIALSNSLAGLTMMPEEIEIVDCSVRIGPAI